MSENDPQLFPWIRYWSKRGESPTLDEGFLVPPSAGLRWSRPVQSTALVTLPKLEAVPCLVLLGDVGTGKSVEITREAERIAATHTDANHVVLSFDLKLRSPDLIEREAFSSPEFVGWTEGRHALTLFFDSMDECWRRVAELGPLLLARLRPKKDSPPLRVRLSCRAAEWQDEIERDLRRAFGADSRPDNFQVWQLAPLTTDDVRTAAVTSGIDGEAFQRQLSDADLNALAAHPITLGMLLDMARDGKALGKTRAEIYAAGCERLCQDGHQVKRSLPRLTTTAPERLACATHIAALSVLANRYLVFGSSDERSPDDTGVLAGIDLVGQTARSSKSGVEMTGKRLTETLQSGLFQGQPGGFYTWRHQSYAEYLAARYMSDREATPEELVRWLCDTSTGVARIWPQLEETACWLVALEPAVFDLLVQTNADVFVRCDPAGLSPEQRAKIVASYLDQVRHHEARVPFWEKNTRLHRLGYAGMEKQLAPVIRDRAESWYVRDLALDFARECNVGALAERCMEIFLDATEVPRLRHSAGLALRTWADDAMRSKIKQNLDRALDTDSQDDVRGCVLRLLWPTHLTAQEIVRLLTVPKRSNYVGSYAVFLREKLAPAITITDLPVFLRWVAHVEPDNDSIDHDPFDGACGQICLKAYHALADGTVRTEFLKLVAVFSRADGTLLPKRTPDYAAETAVRRIFWVDFLASDLPVDEIIIRASLRESGIVHPMDFAWVVEQLSAMMSPEARKRWIDFLFHLFSPYNFPDHLELVQPMIQADPSVAQRVLVYTSCQLQEGGRPNWQKYDYYTKIKRDMEAVRRTPFAAVVDNLLAKYDAGDDWAMWQLMEVLRSPVTEQDRPSSTVAPLGWVLISSAQRQRILAIAPKYLESTPIDLMRVYDSEHRYRSYNAGVRLLLELQRENSAWLAAQSSGFWQTWTPVTLVYCDRVRISDEEPWGGLFALAHQHAPDVFVSTLEKWLSNRAGAYIPDSTLNALPVAAGSAVERTLIRVAEGSDLGNGRGFQFFDFLLSRDSGAAEEVLATWRESNSPSSSPEKAALADALLLCRRPIEYGVEITTEMMANVAHGTKVLGWIVSGGSIRSGWIAHLPAKLIAQFWEWLELHFPGDPYFENHDGTVGFNHQVYDLRRIVIGHLEACGKPDAVDALIGVVRRNPNQPWIGQVLAAARHNCRRLTWKPPTAAAVSQYLPTLTQRPLCTDGDLCDAILASLHRYQAKLKEDNPTKELWNEPSPPAEIWAPKDERNLSDCLARHLRTDLRQHDVVVARESELRRKTGAAPGDLPDIVVEAPSAAGDHTVLKVILEVKGAWNPDAPTSVAAQLHDRYMRGAQCGIHLTGYFTCPSWKGDDWRRTSSLSVGTFENARAQMLAEKLNLEQTTTKRVEVFVLNAAV